MAGRCKRVTLVTYPPYAPTYLPSLFLKDTLNPFFATKDQLEKIESIEKQSPVLALYIGPFMVYHRIKERMDLTFHLANDLIDIMEGRKKLPIKPKTERKRKNG
jgi:hypothetical protein